MLSDRVFERLDESFTRTAEFVAGDTATHLVAEVLADENPIAASFPDLITKEDPFVFRTSETGGLDYSKAIPILDEAHVDSSGRAYVRSSELPIIRKNRGTIKDGCEGAVLCE